MKVDYTQIIRETPEELKKLKNQQNKVVSFQKIQSLYLLKIGKIQTVTDLAIFLGVHRVTIQKWLRKYQEGGLEELLKIKPLTGRPSQLNEPAITELEARLNEAENGFKTYGEIQAWLEENCSVKINYKTLYHWLKYRLKAKLKVPRRTAARKDESLALELKKNFPCG